MTALRAAAIPIVVATLGACGGGGGGGSAIEVPFTTFAAIQPNQTVVMDSLARSTNVAYTEDGFGNVTVTSTTPTAESPGTMHLSYNGARALSGISINAPGSSISFSQGTPSHSIVCEFGTCLAESLTASAAIADPFAFAPNWNYQTFGVWGHDTGVGSSVFGALSAGRPTPGNAVPPPGIHPFRGITAGFYVNAGGVPFATAATLNASVDFSARSITFNTSNTNVVNINTQGPSTLNPDLNLTGTLNFPSGFAFSGNVTTSHLTEGNRLSGTATGRFYGPAAEEMGGTYDLSRGSSPERMIGGFGAKR